MSIKDLNNSVLTVKAWNATMLFTIEDWLTKNISGDWVMLPDPVVGKNPLSRILLIYNDPDRTKLDQIITRFNNTWQLTTRKRFKEEIIEAIKNGLGFKILLRDVAENEVNTWLIERFVQNLDFWMVPSGEIVTQEDCCIQFFFRDEHHALMFKLAFSEIIYSTTFDLPIK